MFEYKASKVKMEASANAVDQMVVATTIWWEGKRSHVRVIDVRNFKFQNFV